MYPTQIDGVNKTPSDLESEFFSRTDQLIVLSGKFNSSSEGVDANLWNNINITIEFLGAGIADSNNSLDVIVKTKTNGSFHYNFSLSLANFSDPTDDLSLIHI